MRTMGLTVVLLLLGTLAHAQAPTLKTALEKAREAEQRSLVLLQATDAYKLFKANSETRQQLETLVKADDAKPKAEK